jgi:uncharacterized membrane protein YedE/YeeE
MDWQTWGVAAIGGAMIGAAAGALLALTGKTAGISGILDGLVRREKSEMGWKAAFVLGLLVGGIGLALFLPESLPTEGLRSPPMMALAGLLVGFGTRLGGGCTSGHGVCGIGRLSVRSIVGTVVFIAVGAITVVVARWLETA